MKLKKMRLRITAGACSLLAVVGVGLLSTGVAYANGVPCNYAEGGALLTCVHLGYGGDANRVAATTRVESGFWNIDTCLTRNGASVGCTGYGTYGNGQVETFAPNVDYAPGDTWCSHTFVGGKLVGQACGVLTG